MPNNDLKIITIIGDSLSLPSSEKEITYKYTYPFKLQLLLGQNEYHVALRSNGRNNVSIAALRENLDRNILFNDSMYIIFHLGIVDCAPRLVGLFGDRILYVMTQVPVLNVLAKLFFKFQTKYRRFFTKYFPKTYISKKDFKEKYGFILREVKKTANPKKVFLINIADTSEKNKKKSYNFEKNILEYNKILEDLASENKDFCELVDLFSATRDHKELMLEDGIHLSKEGHEFLAQLLKEKIKSKR